MPEVPIPHAEVPIQPSLQESLRQLLDTLPVAAYTCDADGLITYYNRPAVELWGREPRIQDPADRWCGSFELFAPDGEPIDHAHCWMALAVANNRPYPREKIRIGRPDGGRRTALAHVNPIRDDAGRVIGAINLLIDVSDRQGADEDRALLAAIVESSDDAIVSMTLEGRVLSWNPGAVRLFGLAARDAIGEPIVRVLPSAAADAQRVALERVASGERVSHYEIEHVTRSGAPIAASIANSPIRDRAGAVVGASMIGRDVSERKRTVLSLMRVKDELAGQFADLSRVHAMSARLFSTHEIGPIMEDALATAAAVEETDLGLVSLCDGDVGTLQVGASLGFEPAFVAEIAHDFPSDGVCGTALAERRRVVVEDMETDPRFEQHRETARRAGVRAVHSTPLITRSGKTVGVLSVYFRRPHRPTDRAMHFADLCARQVADSIENARLYTDLREADRAKNEFLAVLAHELRNPLAPIRNAAETLRTVADGTREERTTIEVIDRQVGHMTRLIDDLLDVARITSGKLELRRTRVSLTAVIAAAVETSRSQLDARGQHLVVAAPDDPIHLDADLTRLAQVIANLLSNASKFSPSSSRIWLTASRDGDDAVIAVRDQGIGIPAGGLDRIFDIFCQGTSGRTQEGLGIGLTLVQRLTGMHGGSVRASSDGPGHGSEFVVRLPAAEDDRSEESPAPADHPAAQPAGKRLRMLIVDDNRDAADSLGMLMRVMGNDAQVAYDGREALTVAAQFHPEVVLLDIGLPTMSGYEVARELRRRPGGGALLLIATTGWGQPSDKEQSREAGFDHHLVKPVDPATLMKLLNQRVQSATSSNGER